MASAAEIDVRVNQDPISRILEQIDEGRLLYQETDISEEEMSRVVENMLLRIPLPSGCFKTKSFDRLCFVGRGVVYTLDRFCLRKDLKLTGLKYFPELNGLGWDELPQRYRRRIKETLWTTHTIDRRTDAEVQQDIVNRYREMFGKY